MNRKTSVLEWSEIWNGPELVWCGVFFTKHTVVMFTKHHRGGDVLK
jgi:hypothetical protein